MAQSVKCELTARIALLGDKDKKSSVVTLYFGPQKVGSRTFAGHWNQDQVLRDLRLNGAKGFKLEDNGELILRSQNIRVPVAPITQEKQSGESTN